MNVEEGHFSLEDFQDAVYSVGGVRMFDYDIGYCLDSAGGGWESCRGRLRCNGSLDGRYKTFRKLREAKRKVEATRNFFRIFSRFE